MYVYIYLYEYVYIYIYKYVYICILLSSIMGCAVSMMGHGVCPLSSHTPCQAPAARGKSCCFHDGSWGVLPVTHHGVC